MAITYEWDINTLEVIPSSASLDNVVKIVHWNYIGSTGSFTRGKEGRCDLLITLGSVASADFVAYDSLTKPLVVGWVTASLGDVYTGSIEDRLSSSLDDDMEPPVVSKVIPW